MKLKLSISILLLLMYSTTMAQLVTKRNVLTMEGLVIRKGPSMKSERLGVLPYGTAVIPFYEVGVSVADTISGIPGTWMQIQQDSISGYYFDGFTSKFPAPKLQDKWVGLDNYMNTRFEKASELKTVAIPNRHGEEEKEKAVQQTFKTGITLTDFGDEEDHDQELIFENANVYEIFLIATAINMNFRYISLNQDYKKVEQEVLEGGSYEIIWNKELKPKRHLIQYYLGISIKKSPDNSIERIELFFDNDAPCAGFMKIFQLPDGKVKLSLEQGCH
jgi:hypothetical protein